jgi:oligoendopeptidase F
MSDGNLFIGQYKGAFVTTVYDVDIPIAYFETTTYSGTFTVAHEFGHYMNEIYSGGKYSQSFDLLESHSKGNEMLFLAYLKNNGGLTEEGMHMVEVYELINMIDSIMHALAVDTFEQAVYTNVYAGPNADKIMADGEITADEYDLLYKSIIEDLGASSYMSGSYWRYMTITSPCYYISYSVSALSVLQLYPMANEDFDAAKDAYLKLFTYVDEYETNDTYMTTEETLEYAGLYSFTDPNLYKYISRFFASFFA